MKTNEYSISHSTVVRAEPEKVHHNIATAEGLDGWFTKDAIDDARVISEI